MIATNILLMLMPTMALMTLSVVIDALLSIMMYRALLEECTIDGEAIEGLSIRYKLNLFESLAVRAYCKVAKKPNLIVGKTVCLGEWR